MPLPSPNLDDRTHKQMVQEAIQYIKSTSPEWTDLSASDPGIVLVEVFAYLTDHLLYQLNRIPDKAYVSFLRLLGLQLMPPSAATVQLCFTRREPLDKPLKIPRGTRVTVSRTSGDRETPVFVLPDELTIPAGQLAVEGLAYHCELVDAEPVGRGTGQPGQWFTVSRPPIVAAADIGRDLRVGVSVQPGDKRESGNFISHAGKTFRIWSETGSFSNQGPDRFVYTVDRSTGRIQFAPALRASQRGAAPYAEGREGQLSAEAVTLAEIPPDGSEVIVWYRHGGGPQGNVAAHTLTVLKDPLDGVEVANPGPASGGMAAETIENARLRGPLEIHALDRAVTASDFVQVALRCGGVDRARALTRAEIWRHALPGTVEVLLVPRLDDHARPGGRVTADALRAQETASIQRSVQETLDYSRPLGTQCIASWTRYKSVTVSARIIVREDENPEAVERRVLNRLHQTINPLPTLGVTSGWPYGQDLYASQVYAIALAEPGVTRVEGIKLSVENVPDGRISALAADFFQPGTWYAASGACVYRTLNNGDSWELAHEFPEAQIETLAVHPDLPGYIAVAASPAGKRQSRVFISSDCAENWKLIASSENFEVYDLAWMARSGQPVLLLATTAGLFQIDINPDASLVQILVDPQHPELGFYAVTASRALLGKVNVAVAAVSTGGVYLSSEGGRERTFRHTGLQGEDKDIRVLEVQYDGPRSFLWAGAAAAGADPGTGCYRWELLGAENPVDRWKSFREGWAGGSCRGIAFLDRTVLAASSRRGVTELNLGEDAPKWASSDQLSGLPRNKEGILLPVNAIATDVMREGHSIMAGSDQGVYRRLIDPGKHDGGDRYSLISNHDFTDRVALPQTWLFCSGDHQIKAERENEKR